jgi:lipoprotein-releasing system permease protein
MFLTFAWRYFKGKKSTQAINIISWVTLGVIMFATCAQLLVLSVYNGFEDLVKESFAIFYSDLKVVPKTGKTITLTSQQILALQQQSFIKNVQPIAEEKALLQHDSYQTVIYLKGVDTGFKKTSELPQKTNNGKFNLGDTLAPLVVLGAGVQYAVALDTESNMPESNNAVIILPKTNQPGNDPLDALSEGQVVASGTFNVQEEFDNKYVFTNLPFVQQLMGLTKNEFTSLELHLDSTKNFNNYQSQIQKIVGSNTIIETRLQQNSSLYRALQVEKWAIYAILCLILIVATFNIVSALTMLILEKQKDISVLQSLGATRYLINKIFVTQGLLLGVIGTAAGVILAFAIAFLQTTFKLIKLNGNTFAIDYYPVKIIATDVLLVTSTAIALTVIAAVIQATRSNFKTLQFT